LSRRTDSSLRFTLRRFGSTSVGTGTSPLRGFARRSTNFRRSTGRASAHCDLQQRCPASRVFDYPGFGKRFSNGFARVKPNISSRTSSGRSPLRRRCPVHVGPPSTRRARALPPSCSLGGWYCFRSVSVSVSVLVLEPDDPVRVAFASGMHHFDASGLVAQSSAQALDVEVAPSERWVSESLRLGHTFTFRALFDFNEEAKLGFDAELEAAHSQQQQRRDDRASDPVAGNDRAYASRDLSGSIRISKRSSS